MRKDYREHETLAPAGMPESAGTASASECTGLMFTPPETPEEREAYEELSPLAFPRREPGDTRPPKRCPGSHGRPAPRR